MTDIKYAVAVIKSAKVKQIISFRVKFRISGSTTKVAKITALPINDKLQLVAEKASTSTAYMLNPVTFDHGREVTAAEVVIFVAPVVFISDFSDF